jgi:hypothetical protein
MYRMVSVTINTIKNRTLNAFEYFPLCQIRINLNVYVFFRNSNLYINKYGCGNVITVPLPYISSKLSLSKCPLPIVLHAAVLRKTILLIITFILTWIFHIHITSNTSMISHYMYDVQSRTVAITLNTIIVTDCCSPTKANIYSAVISELSKKCSATEQDRHYYYCVGQHR